MHANLQINKDRIFAAVLAAGRSTRFGSTKQLATLDGKSLVQRTAGTAAAVFGDRTLLVVGTQWQAVTRSAAEQCTFFVVNEHPENGIGSSIALATRTLRDRADAILILLADQVLITDAYLTKLVDIWSGSSNEIVATEFANTAGPPVLFPSDTFDTLAQLTGDSGAHAVLDDARFNTVCVPFANAEIDIDTRADLENLC